MLRRLAFIRAASNVGLSLEEIRAELAELPDGRTPTKADWLRMSRHWRGRLDEQIAALERLRDGLDSCIGCGCLSLKHCGIANPGDVAASGGPGAAYLPRALRRAVQHQRAYAMRSSVEPSRRGPSLAWISPHAAASRSTASVRTSTGCV